jgi:uncharacterized DUF497 family protein
LKFTWDPIKADTNRQKHGVDFDEAATVFGDPLAGTFPDFDHSVGESRLITVGVSCSERLLVVAHTESPGEIRIISARPATTHERKAYER